MYQHEMNAQMLENQIYRYMLYIYILYIYICFVYITCTYIEAFQSIYLSVSLSLYQNIMSVYHIYIYDIYIYIYVYSNTETNVFTLQNPKPTHHGEDFYPSAVAVPSETELRPGIETWRGDCDLKSTPFEQWTYPIPCFLVLRIFYLA